jgi:hypothetical protein
VASAPAPHSAIAQMNQSIRKWLEMNYQPWRSRPQESLFRGPIGAKGVWPINQATLDYFKQQGVPIKGRIFEDLLESEMFDALKAISSWLPTDKAKEFEETVAFAVCYTHEPNACAMRCLDGYGILFDDAFDTLLISAIELYYSFLIKPEIITADEFPLALNTLIARDFFHITDMSSALAYRPSDDFEHREATNRSLWFLNVFFLAHEAGHVLLGHLKSASEREAIFRTAAGLDHIAVLQPAHREEFAADQYALELLFEGAQRGGLIRAGFDQQLVWQGFYGMLAWTFSLLEAIEIFSVRIGVSLAGSHPPPGQRWDKMRIEICKRVNIHEGVIELHDMMRGDTLKSAAFYRMPVIDRWALEQIRAGRAYTGTAIPISIPRRDN